MKIIGPRKESGPWLALYSDATVPKGKKFGIMVSTGPRNIAISGGTRRHSMLIGWRFWLSHGFIGNYTRAWHW